MRLLISIVTLFFSSIAGIAQIKLPRLISDGMVLQRDQDIIIWGWASANEALEINFKTKRYKVIADSQGNWKIKLPPQPAGGPFEMKFKGTNEVVIKDILFGDVWICAGQSNMVHYFETHQGRYGAEIEQTNYPQIRNYTIPTATNLSGQAIDFQGGEWQAPNPKTMMRFSVVAYFFAKKLHEQYHIPIGIINASVGGTPIEAWTSEAGFKEFPKYLEVIQKNKDTAYVNSTNRAAFIESRKSANRKPADKGLLEKKQWYDTSYIPNNWKIINIPGYWEDQGIRNLDGVVWYRREIDIPTSAHGLSAKIEMGRIIDADIMYINGVQVGNTSYQYPQRRYNVPAGLLKAGKNVIVIRVTNNSGKGGFVPDKPYFLSIGKHIIDLKGDWHYKVGEVFERRGGGVFGIASQNQPAALFNGMIAPMTNYSVKGFVWYQGESNTGKAEEYYQLLPAMIVDWRAQWRQNDAPFLYAQLPNFMEVNYSPEESAWAVLRDAQLKSLRVPNTGMAVTIDLGEWNDIHPDNKKPVGDRLALAALKVAYKENTGVYSGPLYKSSQISGNKIVITFHDNGNSLKSIDGEPLRYFAIAGADKKFVWADAIIENNTVIVWNEQISEPKFVRYAWADNPEGCNLYNNAGLPASPFRTD